MSNHRLLSRRCAVLGIGAGLLSAGCVAAPRRALRVEGVQARLDALGLRIPEVPPSVANYVPYVVTGRLVYLAGQIAFRDGVLLHPGVVPTQVSVEQAQEAARQCAVNLIAALRDACAGDLDRVTRCVRLDGFVASAEDFTLQPLVMNGASDVMVDVFGDLGRHTRVAVGVNVLPLNACVEVAGVFEIA